MLTKVVKRGDCKWWERREKKIFVGWKNEQWNAMLLQPSSFTHHYPLGHLQPRSNNQYRATSTQLNIVLFSFFFLAHVTAHFYHTTELFPSIIQTNLTYKKKNFFYSSLASRLQTITSSSSPSLARPMPAASFRIINEKSAHDFCLLYPFIDPIQVHWVSQWKKF